MEQMMSDSKTISLDTLTLLRRALYDCILVLVERESQCKVQAVKIIRGVSEDGLSPEQRKLVDTLISDAKKLDTHEQKLRVIHERLMIMSIQSWLEDTKHLNRILLAIRKVKHIHEARRIDH